MNALNDAIRIAESYGADVPEHVDVTLDRNAFAAGYLAAAGGIKQALARLKERDDGVSVIARERERQIQEKGYTPEHDDEHDLGELGLAAALYALPYDAKVGNEPLLKQDDFIALHIALETGCGFYVDPEPDPIRRLAKAGALIAAEIDRLRRAAPNANEDKCQNCGGTGIAGYATRDMALDAGDAQLEGQPVACSFCNA